MAIASACVEHLLFPSVLPSEYLQRDGLQHVYRPSVTFWKTVGLCEAGHVAGSAPSSLKTHQKEQHRAQLPDWLLLFLTM